MSKTKTLPPGIPIADAQGKITALSVEELFAKLKIGGRNLLRQQTVTSKSCSMNAAGEISFTKPQDNDTYFRLKPAVDFGKFLSKKLVFSCDVSGLPEGVEWTFGIISQNNAKIKMKNGRVFASFQAPSATSPQFGESLLIDDFDHPLTADQLANVKFSNFMLQEGEIPTAYMPAFEEFSGGG